MRSSVSRRSGADDDHRQAVLAHALEQLAQVCDIGHTEQAARVDLERAEQVAQHRREVLAQPRDAAELQRVRHLVQRDPAQELVVGRLERARGVREVGRDEQQPRGLRRARSTGNSYWPSTRPARKPETAPASIASTPPANVPSGPSLPADPLRGRARARSRATSGWRRSSPRDRPPRPRARAGRRRARCRRRRAAPPRRRAPSSCSNGAGLPAGCMLATPRATVPASFQSITRSRMAGARYGQTGTVRTACEPLARARGDHRRVRLEVQRRGERIVVGDERDLAAGLAHDQLRGGGVDRAAALQRRHRVEAGGGDLAQRDRDRADRAQPVRGLGQRVGGLDDPARVGRLDAEHLELAVARAALAERRVERHAVELSRPRRATRPTPPRARSPARSRTRRRPSSARRRPRSRARECGSPRLALTEPSIGSITTRSVRRRRSRRRRAPR